MQLPVAASPRREPQAGRRHFEVFISRTFTYPNCQRAIGRSGGNDACLAAFNCCQFFGIGIGMGIAKGQREGGRQNGELLVLLGELMCCTLRLTFKCNRHDHNPNHNHNPYSSPSSNSCPSPLVHFTIFIVNFFLLLFDLSFDRQHSCRLRD